MMNINLDGRILLLLSVLVVVLILPHFASAYYVSLMITLFMFSALVQSWNIIGGYCGYISLGHGCFFGIGAYTLAILTKYLGLSLGLALVLAGAFPLIFALAIGYPGLRVRGPYFIALTLAINEITKLIVIDRKELTGGMIGIISPLLLSEVSTYYILLGLAIASTIIIYVIDKSKYGIALLSIKEDEEVAEACGLHTAKYKLLAFAISAVIPGLVGAVTFLYWGYIEPDSAFSILLSFDLVLIPLFGGAGTVSGPIVGTVFYTILSETIGFQFPALHLALFGILMILVILFLPSGLMGFDWRKVAKHLQKSLFR